MTFSVKLCFAVLAVYFAAALFGEAQYRVARARDVTPAYNVVKTLYRCTVIFYIFFAGFIYRRRNILSA